MRKVKGESMKGMDAEIASSMYYPTICLDNEVLPEGKDWKVGKTYRVVLDLKMSGMSQRQSRDGKERGHYDFDIVGIDPQGEAKGSKEKPKRYTGK